MSDTDRTEQTRFKYGMVFIAIVFVEGLITAFLPAFPFVAAIGAQGGALGIYTISKTANNIKNVEGANGNAIQETK